MTQKVITKCYSVDYAEFCGREKSCSTSSIIMELSHENVVVFNNDCQYCSARDTSTSLWMFSLLSLSGHIWALIWSWVRVRFTNVDQISDQLNQVQWWSYIWIKFKSWCVAPTWNSDQLIGCLSAVWHTDEISVTTPSKSSVSSDVFNLLSVMFSLLSLSDYPTIMAKKFEGCQIVLLLIRYFKSK